MIVHHPRLTAGLLTAALALGGSALVAAPAEAVAAPTLEVGLYGTGDPTYDGVFRQSLAILGLHAAGRTPRPEATSWLLGQQCTDGSFMSYRADTAARCADYDPATYLGGADSNATALAIPALYAVGTPAATAAASRAATYLRGIQQPDGGWEYTPGSGNGTDPNSTGLALIGLNSAGLAPTHSVVTYYAGIQVGRSDFAATSAADRGGFSTPWAPGTPDVLATVQSVPGLRGADLLSVPSRAVAWKDDATAYATLPAATVDGIAGWASSYLVGRVDAADVSTGNSAWAVLSLAWDHSGEDAARSLYADLHALAPVTSPAANGQAALAAAAVGRTADTAAYADRIEASLTRDTTAPTATWAAASAAAWRGHPVSLTRSALADDHWATSTLTQRVAWGDGTSQTVTAGSTRLTHVFTSAGTRTVRVTVTDPSGNSRTVTAATLTVRTDTVKPSVTILRPSAASNRSSWNPLVLKASDSRSGVAKVRVKVTQRRSTGWYHFTGTSWVKGATATWIPAARVSGTGARWSIAVTALTRGRLVVEARSVDAAGNRSRTSTASVTLSR